MSRVADVIDGAIIGGSLHLLGRSATDSQWSPEYAVFVAAAAAIMILIATHTLTNRRTTQPPAPSPRESGEGR